MNDFILPRLITVVEKVDRYQKKLGDTMLLKMLP